MANVGAQISGLERKETEFSPGRYRGEVVYVYAFDVAYEMGRQPVRELLGQPVAQFALDISKRNPRQLFFYRPQMVRLPPLERIGPHGSVRVERTVKLLPVGAISISIRVPFDVVNIDDLVVYHDLQFSTGSLYDEVRQLAEDIRNELASYYVRPTATLADEEAYTVFCLESPVNKPDEAPFNAELWWKANRRAVASLLAQEPERDQLSRQEADESTGKYLSYYQHDLVVVDWDAALILDLKQNFDQTLYVMELANLQLAELEAYDQILDNSLDRAYRDLGRSAVRSRGTVLRELREIRIDLARFSDELLNITKFFGDWHLARVYQAVSSRFHLADWHRTIDAKLKTLDDMYQLINHDQTNRWMLILEATIVLLVTDRCAAYCRYCTRSRLVSNASGYDFHPEFERQIAYIRNTPSVRDVLLSGGDPLLFSDDKLEHLLRRLREIPHVEFLRIGTRIPIFLPQRITAKLCEMFRKYHPLFISVHSNHPRELTQESRAALERLADAGIPLGNQSVLLKHVNDDPEVMKLHVQKLLRCRVRPYYIYQCDLISGSAHLRSSVRRGLEIMENLRGHTTGYAVPQYVIDAPGGGGKVPVSPEYVLSRDAERVIIRNYEGNVFEYPEAEDLDQPSGNSRDFAADSCDGRELLCKD